MKKASLVIQDIQNNVYNDMLLDVYMDLQQLEHQKTRYIQAIEKFIDLYGDQEITIYSTPGRSEVVEIIRIINMAKYWLRLLI